MAGLGCMVDMRPDLKHLEALCPVRDILFLLSSPVQTLGDHGEVISV